MTHTNTTTSDWTSNTGNQGAACTLTQEQKRAVLAYVRELTNQGRHKAANDLYLSVFGG